MEKDPVCEMEVDSASANFKTEHKGKVYYFCCAHCKGEFERNPERYIGGC